MASPLLQLEHVTKRFGRVVIAEDLSLTVGPGETVGIVGPNGAGKTSLFGLISGDLAPDAGEVRFDGRTVTRLDAAGEADLARTGGEIPGDEAEQARLARTVRPHDPDRFPRPDRQRQVFRDDDPAEPLRHMLKLKQRARHQLTGWSDAGRR